MSMIGEGGRCRGRAGQAGARGGETWVRSDVARGGADEAGAST
jgi:hypothetical protein